MDALRLKLRAKDQLHPLLQELITGYARFKAAKDWEGRSKMVGWLVLFCLRVEIMGAECYTERLIRLITLNGMKASEEITEEQSRQVRSRLLSFLQSFIHILYSVLFYSSIHSTSTLYLRSAPLRRRPRIRRVLPQLGRWERQRSERRMIPWP